MSDVSLKDIIAGAWESAGVGASNDEYNLVMALIRGEGKCNEFPMQCISHPLVRL